MVHRSDPKNLPPRVAATAQPRAERRPKSRRRVLLAGKVSYFDGAHEFACSIRDISDTGAKIALPKGQPIPKTIALANLTARVLYKAEVVWNNGRDAGVRFLEQIPASDVSEPHLRRLFL